jgi:hypothetical protein
MRIFIDVLPEPCHLGKANVLAESNAGYSYFSLLILKVPFPASHTKRIADEELRG